MRIVAPIPKILNSKKQTKKVTCRMSPALNMYILWLELTPKSLVPLATVESKVLSIQLAQDNAGSQK